MNLLNENQILIQLITKKAAVKTTAFLKRNSF